MTKEAALGDDRRKRLAEYLDGREINLKIEIQWDESEDEHSPYWRTDCAETFYGSEATALLRKIVQE